MPEKIFKKPRSKRLGILILTFLVASVLMPTYQAHAQFGGFSDLIVANGVLALLAGTLDFIRGAVVGLITMIGGGVDSVLKFGIADSPVVKESWEVVRNFANMLFIIALIVMAFGTIFNIQGYNAKTLIARFLIAALLINFSLVIGNVIIGWTQSLSNVFLGAIGDVGARIVVGISIADLFKQSLTQTYIVSGQLWTETITIFFNILLLLVVLFSLLVLFVLSIIRIPILWALLIVSPVAWITYILPTTNHISNRWWKEFIGWNLFLPIYLFFIYFGTFFLANQQRVISVIANQPLAEGLSTTFQQLFFFVLVAIFLIGGAKVAMGMSSAAGAGTIATATWARGRAAARFSTIGLAGYGFKATGIPGAYKEAKEHIQKEGFAGTPLEGIPIIGGYRGQRGLEEKQTKIAGWLGVPGVAEKQLGRNVDAATKRLKERGAHLNRGELERMMNTGSPEERIAAAQVWAEENYGALTPDQVTGLRNAFGGNINTSLAASTFRKQKWGEMSADQLRELLNQDPANPNRIADENIRTLMYSALIEKGRADTNEIQDALGLARSDGQRAGIIKKSSDILKNASSEDQRLTLFRGIGAGDNETRREMLKLMANTGDKFFLQDEHGNDITPDLTARRLRLRTLTEQSLSEPERKKFLEEVSDKYALDSANVMIDLGLLKDSTGSTITRATANAENLALDQVHSKLSVEKKLSQHSSQYGQSVYQQALGREMQKNIHSYTSHDKYASVQPRIIEAQREARHSIFQQEHFQPFNAQVRQLQDRIRDLRANRPSPTALVTQKHQLQNTMLRKLVDLRNDYEKLCIKENLMTNPIDRAEVEADLRRADSIINTYTTRIASI